MDNIRRELLNANSSFLLIFFVCLGLILLSCILYYLARRFFSKDIHAENSSYLTSLVSVVSANYAFLLGFVIVSLWQTSNNASNEVTQESYQLRFILNDITAIKPIEEDVRKIVGKYVRTVVDEEWSLMRIGLESPKVLPILRELFKVIQSYNPQTETEKTFYREIVSKINILIEKRAQRLIHLDSNLSDQLRFILIVGAFYILAMMAFMHSKSWKMHLLAMSVVSCVIGFNMGFALCLDYPFSGDIAVNSQPYKMGILSQFFEQTDAN